MQTNFEQAWADMKEKLNRAHAPFYNTPEGKAAHKEAMKQFKAACKDLKVRFGVNL